MIDHYRYATHFLLVQTSLAPSQTDYPLPNRLLSGALAPPRLLPLTKILGDRVEAKETQYTEI